MLDEQSLAQFELDGFVMDPLRLSNRSVDRLVGELDNLTSSGESVSTEEDGVTLRALHGVHNENAIFDRLTRSSIFVEPVRELLRSEIYVYQFKIGLKAAFFGDSWPWHQDYSFWKKQDGMERPLAITVAVFIDEVNEFNGPIIFIPRSHRFGCLDEGGQCTVKEADSNWKNHVSKSLTHQSNHLLITELASKYGMFAPKGPRGSILYFHSNVAHSSASNVSPNPRRIIFITYNSVGNVPINVRRPEFLVGRYQKPIRPIEGDEFG